MVDGGCTGVKVCTLPHVMFGSIEFREHGLHACWDSGQAVPVHELAL